VGRRGHVDRLDPEPGGQLGGALRVALGEHEVVDGPTTGEQPRQQRLTDLPRPEHSDPCHGRKR
jgi:hypothetical protein